MQRKKPARKRVYTPSQERSRRTYEDILQAAARILTKDGLVGFSTNRIAEVSGVGVGSIYQYFRNKEEILETIALRHLQEIRAILGAGGSDEASGADMLDGLIDGTLEAHLREPELHKAISEIPSFPTAYRRIAREKQKLNLEIDRLLRGKIRKWSGAEDEKTVGAAALIVSSLVEATIHQAVTEAGGKYDPAVLTGELKQAVRLYLGNLRRRS